MKNIQKNHSSLISGSIGRLLTRLTMPMIGGILAMVMFNLVDTIFVGRLGRDELAAMGFIYPVVLVIGSIALGMGIGASSVISRAIGEGNLQKVRRLTTDSLLLAFLLVAVFAVTGFFTIKPLFRAMGASGVILEHIRSYMSIWYAGVLFVIVPMVGNNAIRATGDTKTPSLIMMTAVGVNILFDPLLIFGMGPFPRMGIAGAALATVFARAITFLVALYVLYKRDKLITLKIPGLDELWRSWKSLLYIGIPAAGANIIQPLSIGVITRILSVFGPGIVAAFGAVSRVEMFSLTVIMALATALNPFIGQNYGAKKRDRVRQGIKLSIRFTLYWGLFLTILFIFLAPVVSRLFNKSPDVINGIKAYLYIVAFSFGFRGIFILSTNIFNVLNKPFKSVTLSLLRMFVLYIPLAYIGGELFGYKGVFIAAAVTNTLTAGACLLWIRKDRIFKQSD